MKNSIKRLIAVLVLSMLVIPLSGCALINVNPERDNAQIIATVGDDEVLKEDFNCYMAYLQMTYKMNGSSMPTGKNLKTLKEEVFNSIVDMNVLAAKYEEEEKKDPEDSSDDIESEVEEIRDSLGDDAFANILKANYVTEEQFEDWYARNTVLTEKANDVFEKYEEEIEDDPSIVLDEVVGTVGGQDVTRSEYNYYYIIQAVQSGDSYDYDEINEKAFENIELNRANIEYCEQNEIEIDEDEINEQYDSLKTFYEYYGLADDDLEEILDSFYMTEKIWKSWMKEEAKGKAAKVAIQDYEKENAAVSEKSIRSYYEENEDDFTTQKVSALHILTEDKDLATRIYNKAKDKDKENFEELIEHYEGDERIIEASDLGAFDDTTMVSEFTEASFGAEVNTAVGPVKTEYGYHVIYVYDKTGDEGQSLEEAHDEIEELLKEEKGSESYDKIQEKLENQYKIKIYDIRDVQSVYAAQIAEEVGLKKWPRRVGI